MSKLRGESPPDQSEVDRLRAEMDAEESDDPMADSDSRFSWDDDEVEIVSGSKSLSTKFNPNHDSLGRFATGPGGGAMAADRGGGSGTAAGLVPLRRQGDKWVTDDGDDLPERAHGLRIPPAWKDVTFNPDPDSEPVVSGYDAKGRKQSLYSASHKMESAAEKFSRVSELAEKRAYIARQNDNNLKHADPKVREAAALTKLIMETGVRPGSEKDTGGARKAYGATTLEGRHVYEGARGVRLRFVGKKGVDVSVPVKDEATAKLLVERAKAAGHKGRLFDASDGELRDYVRTLDGGEFTPKDFRTLLGTSMAAKMVNAVKRPPRTLKEYKKKVREVAQAVADQLGNTPTVALQSYINPTVFSAWKPADA
jgi:DNA topoisomerase-1